MSRELDTRDFTRNRVTPRRAMELQSLASAISDRLPGKHRIAIERLDPNTGNASHIVSHAATPTADGNFIKRALDHVRLIGPAMGLTSASELVADSTVQVTASGARAVILHQRHKGIAIFQARTTVRFSPDGILQDTSAQTVAVTRDASAVAKLSLLDAARIAARYIAEPDDRGAEPAVDLTGFEPTIRSAFHNVADRPSVLEPGPFGAEIRANLVWFSRDDQLALGWNLTFTMPDHTEHYHVVVDAVSGQMLYCHGTSDTAQPSARGSSPSLPNVGNQAGDAVRSPIAITG
jgi:hypothetical protein